MKTVALIPIKLNNERLPGKNTKLLGGIPLISYSLETLLAVTDFAEIYVYCSSSDIIRFLPFGVTFLKRPQYLDAPEANFTQIFEMFSKTITSDIYVYAHATAPFMALDSIQRGLGAVKSGLYDSAFCAERIQDFLWQDGAPINFDRGNLPRSQDLPVIYRETSSFYIFKKDAFDRFNSRIGEKPYVIEVGRKEAVDINTEEDFRFAEVMLNVSLS